MGCTTVAIRFFFHGLQKKSKMLTFPNPPYTSSKMQIVPGQDVDLRLPRRASEEDDLLLEFWIPEKGRDATNNFFPRANRFYKWGYYGGPI